MASDPLSVKDEMELTSSEINLPHNLDEMPSKKESNMSWRAESQAYSNQASLLILMMEDFLNML